MICVATFTSPTTLCISSFKEDPEEFRYLLGKEDIETRNHFTFRTD
jgi:hypothetical protein